MAREREGRMEEEADGERGGWVESTFTGSEKHVINGNLNSIS